VCVVIFFSSPFFQFGEELCFFFVFIYTCACVACVLRTLRFLKMRAPLNAKEPTGYIFERAQIISFFFFQTERCHHSRIILPLLFQKMKQKKMASNKKKENWRGLDPPSENLDDGRAKKFRCTTRKQKRRKEK
jgi:hypothetical protein